MMPPQTIMDLIRLTCQAGCAVMDIYQGELDICTKADDSPVTAADLAAEEIILNGLAGLAPDTPVISEEAAADGRIPEAGRTFFLVDPLDGTREFISRNGEFTINIARIEEGRPVAGIVYAPAVKRMFWGLAGTGSGQAEIACNQDLDTVQWLPAHTRTIPASGAVAVASRSHRDDQTNAWLAEHGISDITSAGSSLKFCLLAAGEADVYPRFGRTMEWDTAAGHAVLAAAGGSVVTADGAIPLTYGKSERGYDNPGFIARGR